MARKQRLFIMVMGLWLTILSTQTLCQHSWMKELIGRDPQRWFNMTDEEQREAIEEYNYQRNQERLKKGEAERMQRCLEAWTRLLRVTAQRWKRIEQAYEKTNIIMREETRFAVSYGGGLRTDTSRLTDEKPKILWRKYAKMTGALAPTIDEMTEGQRVVDELIDLLEDENARDQAIREKIDALQQARAKAREELPRAKQALSNCLTTRRQEAVFLLMGLID